MSGLRRISGLGTKPRSTPPRSGLDRKSSTAKPPAMPTISVTTMPSRMRNRCCCTNSTMSTSSAVMTTPDGERDAEQQIEGDGRPDDLGQVARRNRDLGQHPEHDGRPARVVGAARLGQVVAGADAQPHGQRLQQDRHQVRQQDDAEQRVAEPGAAGEVGGPVAGIHVADGDEIARAREREQLAPEAGGHRDRHGPVHLRQALVRRFDAHGVSLHQGTRARGSGFGTPAFAKRPGGRLRRGKRGSGSAEGLPFASLRDCAATPWRTCRPDWRS